MPRRSAKSPQRAPSVAVHGPAYSLRDKAAPLPDIIAVRCVDVELCAAGVSNRLSTRTVSARLQQAHLLLFAVDPEKQCALAQGACVVGGDSSARLRTSGGHPGYLTVHLEMPFEGCLQRIGTGICPLEDTIRATLAEKQAIRTRVYVTSGKALAPDDNRYLFPAQAPRDWVATVTLRLAAGDCDRGSVLKDGVAIDTTRTQQKWWWYTTRPEIAEAIKRTVDVYKHLYELGKDGKTPYLGWYTNTVPFGAYMAPVAVFVQHLLSKEACRAHYSTLLRMLRLWPSECLPSGDRSTDDDRAELRYLSALLLTTNAFVYAHDRKLCGYTETFTDLLSTVAALSTVYGDRAVDYMGADCEDYALLLARFHEMFRTFDVSDIPTTVDDEDRRLVEAAVSYARKYSVIILSCSACAPSAHPVERVDEGEGLCTHTLAALVRPDDLEKMIEGGTLDDTLDIRLLEGTACNFPCESWVGSSPLRRNEGDDDRKVPRVRKSLPPWMSVRLAATTEGVREECKSTGTDLVCVGAGTQVNSEFYRWVTTLVVPRRVDDRTEWTMCWPEAPVTVDDFVQVGARLVPCPPRTEKEQAEWSAWLNVVSPVVGAAAWHEAEPSLHRTTDCTTDAGQGEWGRACMTQGVGVVRGCDYL